MLNTSFVGGCPEKVKLKCRNCEQTFQSSWTLIQHVQNVHNISLYKQGDQRTKIYSAKEKYFESVNTNVSIHIDCPDFTKCKVTYSSAFRPNRNYTINE